MIGKEKAFTATGATGAKVRKSPSSRVIADIARDRKAKAKAAKEAPETRRKIG